MRNYIEQHIKEPAQAYIASKYEEASKAFDDEPFTVSSVAGSINDRTRARNCFIMGTVVARGNSKLHNCVIAKNAKITLEDGAVVDNCIIGGGGRQDDMDIPIEVHIGKGSVLCNSSIYVPLKIGKSSGVIYSSLYSSGLQKHKTAVPAFKFGNNVLLINSSLYIGDPISTSETSNEYVFGNHCVMTHCKLIVKDNVITAGDDNIFGGYNLLLKACLDGIAETVKVIEGHPASQQYDIESVNEEDSCTTIMLDTNVTIGNRCLFAAPVGLVRVVSDAHRATASIDDEVIFVKGRYSQDARRRPHLMFTIGLCGSKISVGERCTVLTKGYSPNALGATKFTFGEGATVVWDNTTRRSAAYTEMSVMPYTLATI